MIQAQLGFKIIFKKLLLIQNPQNFHFLKEELILDAKPTNRGPLQLIIDFQKVFGNRMKTRLENSTSVIQKNQSSPRQIFSNIGGIQNFLWCQILVLSSYVRSRRQV